MELIKTAVLAGFVILWNVICPSLCQRQLRPIGEFDMSQTDAALLCAKMDQENNNATGDPNTAVYQPPDFCFFFQWIYCPNVPEDMDKPCGWWEQKPCNYTGKKSEPHFALQPANPASIDGEGDGDGDGDGNPSFLGIPQVDPPVSGRPPPQVDPPVPGRPPTQVDPPVPGVPQPQVDPPVSGRPPPQIDPVPAGQNSLQIIRPEG